MGLSAGGYWGSLDLRGGLAVPIGERLSVRGELAALGPPSALGLEARLGAGVRLAPGVTVEAGGGCGLVGREAVPGWRGVVGLTMARSLAPAPALVPVAAVVAPPPAPPEAPPPREPPPQEPPAGPSLPQPLRLVIAFEEERFAAAALPIVTALASDIQAAPEVRVRLEVHMRAVPDVDDFVTSQARADLLRDALIMRGVSPRSVEAIGFGAGLLNEDLVDVVVIP
jgi:hypothetical protein